MPRTVTVVGLGYIGLPTAAMLATHGHLVNGYDIRPEIVEILRSGNVHIEEPGLEAFVRDAVRQGRLRPSTKLEPADAYILCVPTPVDHTTHRPDLSYVESATKAILPLLKKGDLVILESTVPAGTVDDVMVPILTKAGWDCKADLLVAHCPETVLPGSILHELAHNHRVVGGHTPAAAEAAAEIYRSFVKADLVVTDATTAEFVKLAQNTYRDVNIALANELAILCRDLGIDARNAIRLANRHPRVQIHQPGPGVGGHCIPVDPWFLIDQAPHAKVMPAARHVNDGMPGYVVGRVKALLAHHKAKAPPVVAVLGLSYKGNVDDLRESPALDILRLLPERIPGVQVRAHDPHITPDKHPVVPFDAAAQGADVLLLVTDHAEFKAIDPAAAARLVRTRLVVDTRGLLDAAKWKAAGFQVETL